MYFKDLRMCVCTHMCMRMVLWVPVKVRDIESPGAWIAGDPESLSVCDRN